MKILLVQESREQTVALVYVYPRDAQKTLAILHDKKAGIAILAARQFKGASELGRPREGFYRGEHYAQVKKVPELPLPPKQFRTSVVV